MTQHNARLLNEPRLRKVVELTDDVSSYTQEIADAFADYENAAELTGDERTEARDAARDSFMESWSNLMVTLDQLRAEHAHVTAALGE